MDRSAAEAAAAEGKARFCELLNARFFVVLNVKNRLTAPPTER
jgi:hypothetical protein